MNTHDTDPGAARDTRVKRTDTVLDSDGHELTVEFTHERGKGAAADHEARKLADSATRSFGYYEASAITSITTRPTYAFDRTTWTFALPSRTRAEILAEEARDRTTTFIRCLGVTNSQLRKANPEELGLVEEIDDEEDVVDRLGITLLEYTAAVLDIAESHGWCVDAAQLVLEAFATVQPRP